MMSPFEEGGNIMISAIFPEIALVPFLTSGLGE